MYTMDLYMSKLSSSVQIVLKKNSNKTAEVDQSAVLLGLKAYGHSQRQQRNLKSNKISAYTYTQWQKECKGNAVVCITLISVKDIVVDCNAPLVLTASTAHLPGETLAPFHISTVAPRLPRLSAFLLFPTYLSILR